MRDIKVSNLKESKERVTDVFIYLFRRTGVNQDPVYYKVSKWEGENQSSVSPPVPKPDIRVFCVLGFTNLCFPSFKDFRL